jgi:hypothetical protein
MIQTIISPILFTAQKTNLSKKENQQFLNIF